MFERGIIEALSLAKRCIPGRPGRPGRGQGMSSCHGTTPIVEAGQQSWGSLPRSRLSGTAPEQTCTLQSLQDNIGPKLMERVTHTAGITERKNCRLLRRRSRVLRWRLARRFAVRQIVCLNRIVSGCCLGNAPLLDRFHSWQPNALDYLFTTGPVADQPD